MCGGLLLSSGALPASEKREEGLKKLRADIEYAATKQRLEALKKVEKLKDDELKQFEALILKIAADDRDSIVRERTLTMIGKLKLRSGEGALIKAIESGQTDLQVAAVRSSAHLKAPAVGPAIEKMLSAQDFSAMSVLISASVNTLGVLNTRSELLRQKYADPKIHEEIKQQIILYFGKTKAMDMEPRLLEVARSANEGPVARAYAVNALGKMQARGSLGPLKELYAEITAVHNPAQKARLSPVKLNLLATLIQLGESNLWPELEAAARDDDANARLQAIELIRQSRYPEARPLLEYKAKNDPSRQVRKEAAKALAEY
ncbi:MAG: HEAT repeat domain-containing protein [Spirochaetales bacterium]|nr:HEAT repeat domain-containing protein [Spirochaetales bacterium]